MLVDVLFKYECMVGHLFVLSWVMLFLGVLFWSDIG